MLSNSLAQSALDHCIFPMIDAAEVHRTGPMVFLEGKGLSLTTAEGKTIKDMISSHTRANSLGYGNTEIAEAYATQAAKMHYGGTANFTSEPMIRLAETIADLAPGDLSRVFFVSGGSEAVESALKIAKQYQQGSGNKPKAYKVISRWNAYHGATMGALSVTDWLSVADVSDPRVPGASFIPNPQCYRNEFGMDPDAYFDLCADYLEAQIKFEDPDLVAAFIAEPVMQANGVQIAPKRYFERVREICTKYGVLLIIDEVICGFGRTGKWFANRHYDVEPDIMTTAKALTAGYAPMGAVVTTPAIADAIAHFRHVHTFSGHAACAAAALAVIAIKQREGLVDKALANGVYFQDALKKTILPLPIVGDVRGLGHWHAVDFTTDKATKAAFADGTVKAVADRMFELGVLVGIAGTAIEIAPPLIATPADIDETVAVMETAINDVVARRNLA
ncbi:aminotransferase family protein [Acuticoccus mangrovi]|uniref:Aspartate aminotransferase family protein n=1 Tax=Acuticoccus mangrovi TaxID=2796142 RepID=A0A934ITE4_9HYPH|nr:aspartate aminotransferase family protein [Acuticoccus mangrovi]MBJ3778476.1 aspartate aminotransferase family protein [Acuticoccus mangrovi]